MIDVAAKILADNLAALLARAANEAADASPDRPCNLAYTLSVLQRMAPRLLSFTEEIGDLIASALAAIARTIKRRKPQRSAPRNQSRVKPHPSAAHKGLNARCRGASQSSLRSGLACAAAAALAAAAQPMPEETPLPLKITAAKVIVCSPSRNFVTLKIETDQGLTGLGDATLNGRELAVASYLQDHVVPCLIGRDAHQIEDLWHYLYRGAY